MTADQIDAALDGYMRACASSDVEARDAIRAQLRAALSQAPAEVDELPPLPEAEGEFYVNDQGVWVERSRGDGTPLFTACQMQDYARAALASKAQPKGTEAEAQEWNYVIECRDGFVPNVKGPFNNKFTESTLREFAAMRPSYLMVVRSTGWPSVESGEEWISMFGDKRRGRLARPDGTREALELALRTLQNVPDEIVMGDHPVFGKLRAAIAAHPPVQPLGGA